MEADRVDQNKLGLSRCNAEEIGRVLPSEMGNNIAKFMFKNLVKTTNMNVIGTSDRHTQHGKICTSLFLSS